MAIERLNVGILNWKEIMSSMNDIKESKMTCESNRDGNEVWSKQVEEYLKEIGFDNINIDNGKSNHFSRDLGMIQCSDDG